MLVNGFKCLKCFSNIYVEYYTFRQYNGRVPSADCGSLKRYDKCSCGNCGVILDLDGLVHLYCDDITTILLCRIDTEAPSDIEILGTSGLFYYQDYSEIAHGSYQFIDTKQKLKLKKRNVIKHAFKRKEKYGKKG